MTPCSSCSLRTKAPISAPACAPSGSSRARRREPPSARPQGSRDFETDEARAQHDHAPRFVARAMISRQSASERKVRTCCSSAPGIWSRTGSAPVASSSRSNSSALPSASVSRRAFASRPLVMAPSRRSIVILGQNSPAAAAATPPARRRRDSPSRDWGDRAAARPRRST